MSDESLLIEPRAQDRSEEQRIGEAILHAAVQTGACFSTDFIDPPVSKWLQGRYGSGATLKQVWGGELIGDTVDGIAYVAIKQISHMLAKVPFVGDPVERAIAKFETVKDASFSESGEKALEHWAEKHHIDKSDPRYIRKLENHEYKEAEAKIDSYIVAGSAGISNILAQRHLFQNTNPMPVIIGSKLGCVLN